MSSADELICAAKNLLNNGSCKKNNTVSRKRKIRADSKVALSSVDSKLAKEILRKMSIENAFHFHREIGRPLRISSNNLADFCEKIHTVDPKAVEFHFCRGDFAQWVGHLGDIELSRKLRLLGEANLSGESLREELCRIIKFRCDELQRLTNLNPNTSPDHGFAILDT